ncbi:hypothetical protein QYF36_021612 [Acer negundo]|nr:hypothetical protein QYF36_021612 [Acer negundo]
MDEKLILVSWASPDDPAQGKFKFQKEETQYIIRKERSTYWKSGVSGDFIPESDVRDPRLSPLLSNRNGSDLNLTTLTYNIGNSTNKITSSSFNETKRRLVMKYDGNVEYLTLLKESGKWESTWLEPQYPCNQFRACGSSASCSSKNNMRCECLPGFEPISPVKISEGCSRKGLLCSNGVEGKSFKPLKVIQVGKTDVTYEANNENECKEECLKDCNCQAYSFQRPEMSQLRGATACWVWVEDLNNIWIDDTDRGREIQFRMPLIIADEANLPKQDGVLDETNKQFKQWPLAFAVTVAIVIALAFTIFYIYTRNKKDRTSDLPLHFYDGQRHVRELIDSEGLNDEDKKGIDLPFFDFESIVAATDNFSEANKLGKGGFGPVYKGNFPGGQEIAVKRLSRVSGEEKILLYEFMPNKSLDSFIFDPNLGKQTEGATNRVVGTYGYMSPEYALDGFFSVKSDIFSFGVVILEIISGKKNTGFYNSQEALSLLGHAWRLWQEDKALDMMDQKLSAGINAVSEFRAFETD